MKKLVAFLATGLLASASAYASITASAARPNYDAAAASAAAATRQGANKVAALNAGLHAALLHAPRFKPQGYSSTFDKDTGAATFLWAPPGLRAKNAAAAPAVAFSPLQPKLRAETMARTWLGQEASYLRLDREAIAQARISSVQDLGRGPVIARFVQYQDGLEVFGRSLNVMMDRRLNAVATSGSFAPKARGATPAFALGGEAALSNALNDLGVRTSPFAFSASGSASPYTTYTAARGTGDAHVAGPQYARKVYYYADGRYIPAWLAMVHAESADHGDIQDYAYVVSGVDGKVLFRKNLTDYDTFSYRVFAGASAPFHPEDEPINNNTLDPFTGGPTGNQGRTQDTSFNLVTLTNSGQLGQLPATAAAANDPWLPAGATVTTGNNVVAYANLAGGDGFDPGDLRGAVSSAGTFDYPYTIDVDPTTPSQRQAAITNQFFVDNWLHDAWYDHGFDEAAGNAQIDNYGRGGVGGDPILAQAQDDSGRNNANMSTRADGIPPIQRMYLFDGPPTPDAGVTITAPAGIGALPFNTASFGPHSFNVTGNVVRPQAGDTNGCAAISVDMTGQIALVDRGACSFKTKTLNAQNAGAAAVILADNLAHCTNPGDLSTCEPAPGLGDDASISTPITIGTVSLSYPDGQKLETAAGTVSGIVKITFEPDRDGTMDIQIIAHEFFHYVSNRLVGNAIGLSSQQGGGMGEGWSDFDAMLLTVRPDDAGVSGNDHYQGAYPLSSYVTFNQYFGIRRYPYSTDMNVNPLTFKHISFGVALPASPPAAPGTDLTGTLVQDPAGHVVGNAEVHNVGEVWCNTLWEIYASLLNDPRYTFAQAKSRMQDYIIAGLKMTPNAPTLLEARNALMAAAKATDSGDFTLMAQAFAKRGMGVGAVAPDRNDIKNRGAVESFTALAAGIEVTDAQLSFANVPNTALGDNDHDGVLDSGESAVLSFTLLNTGTADLTTALTGTVAASTPAGGTADIAFGNGGQVPVPPLAVGASETVSVLVTLNSADTAVPVALTLSFPPPANPLPEGGVTASGAEVDAVVNYDLSKTSASDDVEDSQANLGDWTRSSNGTVGPNWQLANDNELFGGDVFGTGQYWFGPDNNAPTDITLTSPVLHAKSSGHFILDFDHFFAFEFDSGNAGFDGGVIEVSTDGGTTWKDAFVDLGAVVKQGAGYNGVIESLDADGTFDPGDGGNHPGFVDQTNVPTLELQHMRLDFADKLKNQNVLIRFRAVSDANTGVLGWIVDNIAVSGITNLPFSKTVADAGAGTQKPSANAGAAQTGTTGALVTLDGSASSDPYGTTLSYAWTQVAGEGDPAATLAGADTAHPTFTPAHGGTYTFQLVVTDQYGRASDPATTTVTVTAVPTANAGAAQSAQTGAVVTLNGSASSDPDGGALTYAWTQTAGPTVTLTGATTAQPTFTPTQAGSYSFSLVVTNPGGQHSAAATTTVTVTAPSDNGGAFAPWLLLPGFLLAALRRRRRG